MARIAALCGFLCLACLASPAHAGCRLSERCWWHAHHAIYHKENHIAFLEADPAVDDGTKGPVITRLRHKILRIRSTIGPRWPHWPVPCCYSRKPIVIR
jgi:hypothetical protein